MTRWQSYHIFDEMQHFFSVYKQLNESATFPQAFAERIDELTMKPLRSVHIFGKKRAPALFS